MSSTSLKKCLWCLKTEPETTFNKKAHTIPKSLGGQNYNGNICDECNAYFGSKEGHNGVYSLEEALKETFNITRRRLLNPKDTKRKVGRFKSKFFEIEKSNQKNKIIIKNNFKFIPSFQKEFARGFKRGLYKMYLEELNIQKGLGYEKKYDIVRNFARYNRGDLPTLYFIRKYGVIFMLKKEAETPKLYFNKMKYLYKDDKFDEIEFLGHVFGFPFTKFSESDLEKYLSNSVKIKKDLFKGYSFVNRITDIDFTFSIMDDK